MAVDPKNPNNVYLGTNNGVLRSTDAGANWTLMNAGLPLNMFGLPPSIHFLAIDPQNPARLYAASYEGGVFVITVDP